MKRAAILAAVSFFACIGIAFAGEISPESRISAVTVYPDSALINRVAEVKLSPGPQKVVFKDIIPEVDENTLKVSGSGTAKVLILGAQVKREYLEEAVAQRVKDVQAKIQELNDQRLVLEDERKAMGDEKQFLDSFRFYSNQELPKELATKMPAAKEIDDLLAFFKSKVQDNYAKGQEITFKTREINKKLESLQKELMDMGGSAGRKMQRSIVVDLDAQSAGAFEVAVSYLVHGATWQPLYDARAEFEKSQVELISQALVSQQTGEDWNGVEVSLSTARPNLGGRLPEVSSWFIRPLQPMEQEAKLLRKKDMRAQYTLAAPAMMDKEVMEAGTLLSEESPAKEKAEYRYAAAENRGLSIVYKLSGKADIKADGSEQKLPVAGQVLKADFKYSAYPRVAPYAYLGSRVTNSPEMQLLGGRVNVFLNGDYVGSSAIDTIGSGEEFDLYMGVDENVKVKREELEKKVDTTFVAGIPSMTKKVTYRYKLTVENYKAKNAKVILFETIPVSQDERIKVNVQQVSLPPADKEWKDRKGVWRWELDIAPKQKQEITYVYTVECPRDMLLEGL
jgi:uncharacterized protein (TIGR02231 family)